MLNTLQTIEASANFLHVKQAAEIMQYLKNLPKDTIIFIDIDDTVITPVSKTFRRAPFNKLIDDIKQHKDQYPNYAQIVSNWRIQRKVMLLDNSWPKTLMELQKNYPVYGLTKMDVGKFGSIDSMEKWRYQELKALGIQFSENSNFPTQITNGAIFYKGIFITGNNSKSQTIGYYLPYLHASIIVMIDDRQEHLEDIDKFCKKHAIAFIGILFKGLENSQEEQDSAIVEIQKQYLIKHAKWLEDEEAAKILKHTRPSNDI